MLGIQVGLVIYRTINNTIYININTLFYIDWDRSIKASIRGLKCKKGIGRESSIACQVWHYSDWESNIVIVLEVIASLV